MLLSSVCAAGQVQKGIAATPLIVMGERDAEEARRMRGLLFLRAW